MKEGAEHLPRPSLFKMLSTPISFLKEEAAKYFHFENDFKIIIMLSRL